MRTAVLISVAIMLVGCSASHDNGVMSRIAESSAPVEAGVVSGVVEHMIEVRHGDQQFHIPNREASLQKFPCQQCHKVPLSEMKHDGKDGRKRAHWNVELRHATDAVMNCSTCHDGADTDRLRTLNNQPVSINASWQVCAQCHFKQAEDWAGGAHGKRVGGWAPPRVSKTCVECHNPHQPAWDHRQPVHVDLTGLARPKERP